MGYALRRTRLPQGWQLCCGIGGNFAMESVATLLWNQWQVWHGISGNFAVESVATFARNTQTPMGSSSSIPCVKAAARSKLAAKASPIIAGLAGANFVCCLINGG